MNRRSWVILLIIGAMGTTASAHNLDLLVTMEGTNLTGRATFNAATPAVGCRITIAAVEDGSSAKETTIAELLTDADGRFRHHLSLPGNYRVTATTDTLHATSAMVRAEEFRFGQRTPPASEVIPFESEPDADQGIAELQDAVRGLREEVHQLQRSIGLRDILGGIGFIVGTLGLLALLKRRKAQ